jgi:hypothetical protein
MRKLMSKYQELGQFLRRQGAEQVPMTFREIEKVTGSKLPSSKQYPAWWSNNIMNNVMTKVWLDAGYRTEQVDIAGEKLVFRRAIPGMQENNRMFVPAPNGEIPANHPMIGALKGTFIMEPGWDLSAPALDQADLEGIDAGIDKTANLIERGMRGGAR